MVYKKCSKCEVDKSTSLFTKKSSNKDKLDNWCKLCKQKYIIENKEDVKETQRWWYQNNKVKLKNERDRKNKLSKRV